MTHTLISLRTLELGSNQLPNTFAELRDRLRDLVLWSSLVPSDAGIGSDDTDSKPKAGFVRSGVSSQYPKRPGGRTSQVTLKHGEASVLEWLVFQLKRVGL